MISKDTTASRALEGKQGFQNEGVTIARAHCGRRLYHRIFT
jgi:hypothetical protein